MSAQKRKKEKKINRIYIALMVFFYVIYVPVSVAGWLGGDEGFPITAVTVGIGLPIMRSTHLNRLREQS